MREIVAANGQTARYFGAEEGDPSADYVYTFYNSQEMIEQGLFQGVTEDLLEALCRLRGGVQPVFGGHRRRQLAGRVPQRGVGSPDHPTRHGQGDPQVDLAGKHRQSHGRYHVGRSAQPVDGQIAAAREHPSHYPQPATPHHRDGQQWIRHRLEQLSDRVRPSTGQPPLPVARKPSVLHAPPHDPGPAGRDGGDHHRSPDRPHRFQSEHGVVAHGFDRKALLDLRGYAG